MTDDLTFSDCRCGAGDERILIERCTATWRILGDVYVVYCTECGEAESFVSMDRNDASALNGYALHAWNNRHGARDADRSAELTTAWMAGAERERDRAARDVEDAARYRWLRNHGGTLAVCDEETSYYLEQLDAAIDAARAGERG